MRASLSLGIAILLSSAAAAWAQSAESGAPPAVETAVVALAPVSPEEQFIGSVTAIQQVNLMARVEGFLEEVAFEEGSLLQAGDVAFRIEQDTYQAALDSARAALQAAIAAEAGAQAGLTNAELTLARQKQLLRSDTASQAAVDQAQAARDTADAQVKQAQAQIAQAQAQVTTAEINLSFTAVETPITGRIGRAQVTLGNLVSPASGTLATVIQVDPIRVVFAISDRDYLRVLAKLQEEGGNNGEPQTAAFVPQLTLPDGSLYEEAGKIAFIDNTVDPGTGTIAVYAEFPNPHLKLVPGQFVNVMVQASRAQSLPVVPATAVQRDQEGAYVFVLDGENRAVIRRVELGQRVGVDWAVLSGLAAGEVVIVSGIQKIRPGIVVAPQPAPTQPATGN